MNGADSDDRLEAAVSMGIDTLISKMLDKSNLLYTYFKYNFSQVTKPAYQPNPRKADDEPGIVYLLTSEHP